MVRAELEKNLKRSGESKSAQNGKKTSVSAQIDNTINAVDSIIADLRGSQNEDATNNTIADQPTSSLTEVRGKTLRRTPVIVWQDPRIHLKDEPIIKKPEPAEEDKENGQQIIQPETESLGEYISGEQFYKTIEMSQVSWSRNKREYPEVRAIKRGRSKFFQREDAEKIREIHELKKAEKETKKDKSKQLTAPPEGYISYKVFLDTLGITRERWRQIKKSFPIPTKIKVGRKFYFLRADVDAIKRQRDSKTTKPRISAHVQSAASLKPRKTEDVEKIAKAPQQRANGRMDARMSRKPTFEREFKEMMEGSEQEDSHDIDILNLHLKEIGQIPIEVKKHKIWGIKIQNGLLAVMVLESFLNSNLLDSCQKQQIEQILETPRAKHFLYELRFIIENQPKKEKAGKIDLADKTFSEILRRLSLWFSKLKSADMPQAIEHQIKLFNSGSEAFDNFVTSNMRLVVNIAKKYRWSDFSMLDLIGYGNEGLIKAVIKFDWRKNYQFSTYAIWWIRQSITRAIADYSTTIRVPVHIHERIWKFKKRADELLQKGEDIDYEDLANEADPTGNLARGLRTRNLVSLTSTVGPDQDSFLQDFLEDVKSNMEDGSDKIGMRGALMEALDTLLPRERKVLMMRYGMEDGKSKTLEQVGDNLHVTRERIRQIETNALRKLRHHSRAKKLRPYFDDDPRPIKIHPGQTAGVLRSDKKKNIT